MKGKRITTFHPQLASRIAFFMEREGKNLTELAKAAGYSQGGGMMTQIVKYGTTGVDYDRLEKIAKELNVEPDTLAYPGKIDESKLVLLDSFFKLLRKKKPTHLETISHLIFEDTKDMRRSSK